MYLLVIFEIYLFLMDYRYLTTLEQHRDNIVNGSGVELPSYQIKS